MTFPRDAVFRSPSPRLGLGAVGLGALPASLPAATVSSIVASCGAQGGQAASNLNADGTYSGVTCTNSTSGAGITASACPSLGGVVSQNGSTVTCAYTAPAAAVPPAATTYAPTSACLALAQQSCQASGWIWNTSLAAYPQGVCQVTSGASSGSYQSAYTAYTAGTGGGGVCVLGAPNGPAVNACSALAQQSCASQGGTFIGGVCTVAGVPTTAFANTITGACTLGSVNLGAAGASPSIASCYALGQAYNPTLGICLACPAGQAPDPTTGTCSIGQATPPGGCPAGQISVNGQCVINPATMPPSAAACYAQGQAFNAATVACYACSAGYVATPTGVCAASTALVQNCPTGTTLVNGVCTAATTSTGTIVLAVGAVGVVAAGLWYAWKEKML
jgi:hypothetical protein